MYMNQCTKHIVILIWCTKAMTNAWQLRVLEVVGRHYSSLLELIRMTLQGMRNLEMHTMIEEDNCVCMD